MTRFDFTATATVTKERTFEGLAAPYGTVTRDGRNVAFAPGAFGNVDDLALVGVLIQHPFSSGDPAVRIGRVETWTDSEDGLQFSARLNDSEAADAIYESLKTGDVFEVSLGVYVNSSDEDEDGLTTFTSAEVLELSVITEGSSAFAESQISAVFAAVSTTSNESNSMEDTTATEVAELREDVAELTRSFAMFESNSAPEEAPESRFNTFGALVKAVAKGDEDAIAEYEAFAYAGGTSDDTSVRNGWVRDHLKFTEGKRPVLDAFTKEALPSEGMTVEYLKNGTDTTSVAIQTNEGDDLAKGKITLTTATADIKTFGGWSELSVQQLERSSVNVIDATYRALGRRYAQTTEGVVRTLLVNAASPGATGFDPSSYSDLVDYTVDGATALDDAGYSLDFIAVSPSTFKALAKIQVGSSGNYVLDRHDGSLSIKGVSGEVFNVPLLVVPSAAGALFTLASKEAISTWEQGPKRLQDSNVTNLSGAFSLYGYLAAAITDSNGLYVCKV